MQDKKCKGQIHLLQYGPVKECGCHPMAQRGCNLQPLCRGEEAPRGLGEAAALAAVIQRRPRVGVL